MKVKLKLLEIWAYKFIKFLETNAKKIVCVLVILIALFVVSKALFMPMAG